MKEYDDIINSVIQELLPEVIEKHLPNIKYTNRSQLLQIIKPKIEYIYYEYRIIKVEYIIERIHVLSGKPKIFIKKDYENIKNDHNLFKNKLTNEIILYLKNVS